MTEGDENKKLDPALKCGRRKNRAQNDDGDNNPAKAGHFKREQKLKVDKKVKTG